MSPPLLLDPASRFCARKKETREHVYMLKRISNRPIPCQCYYWRGWFSMRERQVGSLQVQRKRRLERKIFFSQGLQSDGILLFTGNTKQNKTVWSWIRKEQDDTFSLLWVYPYIHSLPYEWEEKRIKANATRRIINNKKMGEENEPNSNSMYSLSWSFDLSVFHSLSLRWWDGNWNRSPMSTKQASNGSQSTGERVQTIRRKWK